jgi:hypothetical protein
MAQTYTARKGVSQGVVVVPKLKIGITLIILK